VHRRAELCCEVPRELENKGEYEDAQTILRDYWRDIREAPQLTGLEPNTAGELLLRAGVLTGIIGSKNQICRRAGKSEKSNYSKLHHL
jgi:hypothetical protein